MMDDEDEVVAKLIHEWRVNVRSVETVADWLRLDADEQVTRALGDPAPRQLPLAPLMGLASTSIIAAQHLPGRGTVGIGFPWEARSVARDHRGDRVGEFYARPPGVAAQIPPRAGVHAGTVGAMLGNIFKHYK